MGVGHRDVDISSFEKASNKKMPWAQRMDLIKTKFPSVETINWRTAFDQDIDIFAAILGDILKADGAVPGRSGPKPAIDFKEGTARLRQLMGQDYSEVPFNEAFRFLVDIRSVRHTAAKTGLSRAKVDRLLRGEAVPTSTDMEKIAKAFGKDPGYFVEYRMDVVLSALAKKFIEVPESSVKHYRKLAGWNV